MDSVLFLGDVYLPRRAWSSMRGTAPIVVNLEYPITACENGSTGKVNLKAHENYLEGAFGSHPLIAACLANNHILDYGEEGLEDTLRALRIEDVVCFGAGSKEENYGNPAIIHVGGCRIALLGYVCPSTHPIFSLDGGMGVAPINLDLIVDDLRRAREQDVKRIVVSLHWGVEEARFPRPDDVQIARRIVDAGADLIIGHHAHRIQPFEVYKGGRIYYGLGNCIMPDLDEPSYFDASGNSTGRYVKKQRYWNRRSLGVLYYPDCGRVEHFGFSFDDECLRKSHRIFFPLPLGSLGEKLYSPVFAGMMFIDRFEELAFRFFDRPHNPFSRRGLSGVGSVVRQILRDIRASRS